MFGIKRFDCIFVVLGCTYYPMSPLACLVFGIMRFDYMFVVIVSTYYSMSPGLIPARAAVVSETKHTK